MMSQNAELAMANAFVPGRAQLDDQTEAMIARRGQLLGPAYRLMYEHPLHFVKGEGSWLIDANGRRYLDFYNNVTSLGHCHPAVVEAISRQVGTLATNTRYLQDTILELAERLLATMPKGLQAGRGQMMLTCTGSEANDLAYRIAKVVTGGTGVVVTATAYHGITDAVAAFSPSLGSGVVVPDWVAQVPAPGEVGASTPEEFAQAVERAIQELAGCGHRPAMLIVDTMFTSDGILPLTPGFLAPAVAVLRRAGGIFVADEVQPGFARTGAHFWGFQRHGLLPEIVTMGKPMGNGHPVAGLVAQQDVLREFGLKSRYFNTFGGNTVSCAAALSVLKVIEEKKLQQNAGLMGERFRAGLLEIAQSGEIITEVRNAGLMFGVQLCDKSTTTAIVNGLRNKGLLVSACGQRHDTLKIRPPLTVTTGEIDGAIMTIRDVLAGLS